MSRQSQTLHIDLAFVIPPGDDAESTIVAIQDKVNALNADAARVYRVFDEQWCPVFIKPEQVLIPSYRYYTPRSK